MGLPASPEVGALADMMKRLRPKAESFLGPNLSIEAAGVTIPQLYALYLEDVEDAFEHAGIRELPENKKLVWQDQAPTYHSSALLAGKFVTS